MVGIGVPFVSWIVLLTPESRNLAKFGPQFGAINPVITRHNHHCQEFHAWRSP